jgi:hypothetical protein
MVPGIAVAAWVLFALAVAVGVMMLNRIGSHPGLTIVVSPKLAAYVELSQPGVSVVTAPTKQSEAIFYDLNQDLKPAPNELLGNFPVFDGNNTIDFKWTPYPFAQGVNGSYRIALWQDISPLAATPTFVERKVAHHWAQNPNGTFFVMGSFGYGEEICTYCPSLIVIWAETYTINHNPQTLFTEYIYTFVNPEALTDPVQQGTVIQVSLPFVISIIR